MRVVLQQPTAYVRALDQIEGKYLMAGFSGMTEIKDLMEKAQKYSPIAKWKSWGYYETMIGKSMRQVITGEATIKEKINEKLGSLAGKADDITWGLIWKAAEEKVKDTTNLTYGTEEFYQETAKIFNEVIDNTQVVDTMLHKSQYMRNPDGMHKMASAFLAEPTKSYNMVYRRLVQSYREQDMKKFMKAVYIYILNALMTSVASSIMDMYRDDNEGAEEYLESYLENLKGNFLDNANPLNLFPLLNQIQGAIDGFNSNRYDTEIIAQVVRTVRSLNDVITGENKKTPYAIIYQASKIVSIGRGVPIANSLREVKTIHNNLNNLYGGEDWTTQEKTKYGDMKRYIDKAIDNPEKYRVRMMGEIKKLKEDGVEKGQISSSISSKYKAEYLDRLASGKGAADMQNVLISAFMAAGYTHDEAREKINSWTE